MSKAVQLPIRFHGHDATLRDELERSAQTTGQSMNQLVITCVRVALPSVVAAFAPTGRVTNVDPLPDAVLNRIYSKPDEEDEAGVRRMIKAQAFGGED